MNDDEPIAGAPLDHAAGCPCQRCTGVDWAGHLNKAYRDSLSTTAQPPPEC